MEKCKYWILTGVLVSLALSVLAVCIAAYRTPELSFDYLGVIVGILALLVTVLIGWNIYVVMDVKGINEKMKNLEDNIKFESDKNLYLNNNSTASIYYDIMFKGHETVRIEYNFIQTELYAIFYASKIKNFDAANAETKILIDCAKNAKLKISNREHDRLFEIFDKIKEKENIKRINELRTILFNIRKDDVVRETPNT